MSRLWHEMKRLWLKTRGFTGRAFRAMFRGGGAVLESCGNALAMVGAVLLMIVLVAGIVIAGTSAILSKRTLGVTEDIANHGFYIPAEDWNGGATSSDDKIV